MSTKLPHRHACKECGTIITHECECSVVRVYVKLCHECYVALEAGEGELEF